VFRPLAAVVMTFAMALAVAPPAAAWEPTGGPMFNNPWGKLGARWKIVNHVTRAINGARPGSRVLVSTFLFDSKASADALIEARNRGVQVQVVFDGDDADTHQARRVANRLNRDNVASAPAPAKWGRDNSFAVFCKGSCRAGQANNHTKFYVFTRTGTASDVVMVSSSNLNKGGAVKGWNDLYVAKSKPQMVKQYSGIHAEMAQDSPADGDRFRELVSGQFISRFYPKPRGGDPVMQDLSKVSCTGADGGAGRNGRTAINVSMFAWNGTRGEAIAKRLVRLDKLGCDVSVIYGAPSKVVRNILRDSARRGQVKLWDSRYDRNGDGLFDVRVHHKYMLINGHYGTDRSAWRVHTGSQNWGRGTLRGGDENTLTIVNRGAYAKYMKNWSFVRDNGARRIGR
jgi:phosphatidylserine/phosphatidylglycerophosphate/cardiolipin synthase-like enzyme